MSLQEDRREPGIAVLRLDRPDRRNALDSAALADLLAVLGRLAADEALRVLVLSTTSTDAFCAGADVGERLDEAGGIARMEAFARLYAGLAAFPVPVVCVCVGHTLGAGAELAAGSHLRVGGDNLRLGWVGARLGVPVGPARLVPLVGQAVAAELLLTARVLRVDDARALGLLHRVAPAAEAEATAIGLAEQVAALDPAGVRRMVGLLRDLGDAPGRVARENEALVAFQRHGGGLPQGGRP